MKYLSHPAPQTLTILVQIASEAKPVFGATVTKNVHALTSPITQTLSPKSSLFLASTHGVKNQNYLLRLTVHILLLTLMNVVF